MSENPYQPPQSPPEEPPRPAAPFRSTGRAVCLWAWGIGITSAGLAYLLFHFGRYLVTSLTSSGIDQNSAEAACLIPTVLLMGLAMGSGLVGILGALWWATDAVLHPAKHPEAPSTTPLR